MRDAHTPDLSSLNPEQRKATCTTEGRVLILAGAGSGKTLVLTMRMAYLLNYKGVSPQAILGLTFTNKAAAEMRQRMAKMVGDALAKQVSLCTFHSFCMQVLRKDIDLLGYTRHFSLYDAHDVNRLVMQIGRDLLEHESELPSMAPTLALITKAKNQGALPETSEESTWHDTFSKDVYQRLENSMRAYNAVDFDNLLCLTVRLFKEHPEVLKRYQERFTYLMIDEYQDTNPVQYELAHLLSAKSGNLCVVGDDDQSIYGWRGAQVQNILQFDSAEVIKLEQNYRSTNIILNAANQVIKNNHSRHDKRMWSAKEGGRLIEVFHTPTEQDEAAAVVERLARLREKEGLAWKDIAILYRSNHLSRLFELALMRYTWKDSDVWRQGIPYEIFGGQEYYERREVKDVLAYLRALLNPKDAEALLRVINLPRRGIGDESLDKLTSLVRSSSISLWELLVRETTTPELGLPDRARSGIKQFLNLFKRGREKFSSGTLHENVAWLVEESGMKRAIEEEVKSDKMRQFKWENVQELITSVAEYEEAAKRENKKPTLHDFITSTPLGQEASFKPRKNKGDDLVHLMTFHSAKGLEFSACFLVGLEDHILPHEKSLKETGLEEERRLMYVALTRAKHYLTCSMAKTRKRLGKDYPSRPSRFLFEIPKELLFVSTWNFPP